MPSSMVAIQDICIKLRLCNEAWGVQLQGLSPVECENEAVLATVSSDHESPHSQPRLRLSSLFHIYKCNCALS